MAPDGPEWFDSHCHLQDDFTAEDDGPDAAAPDAGAAAGRLDGVLARAVDAGVTRMVCVGTNAATSAAAVALAGEAALRPGPPGRDVGDRGSASP